MSIIATSAPHQEGSMMGNAPINPKQPVVQQGRALRAHQARLGELFAGWSEDALAAGNRRPAARWQREYVRCVKRCHALGEIVHAGD
jgi:hypothetical protein